MIETKKSSVKLTAYQHKPGGSCIVTALSGLYRYHGLDYGPEQIVGLGSGLHFAYGFNPQENNYRIELISSQLLYSLLCNTGAFGEEYEFTNNEKALFRVLELLDNGMPVPVMMNPLYCEGLMKRTPTQFIDYIPSHLVVVFGYDLQEQVIHFYDSPQFNPVTISMTAFMEARCSGPTLPGNKHFEIYVPNKCYPYDSSVNMAISKVIQVYKSSEKHLAHKSGLDAIGRFVNNVKSWRQIFSDEQIIDNARLFLMAVTNGHATKGAFRNHYSIFLQQATERVNGPGFQEASAAYQHLGKLWIEFQRYLHLLIREPSSNEVWGTHAPFNQLLDELHEKEVAALGILEKDLNKNLHD